MTPNRLAAKIRKLRPRLPITTEFERALAKQGTWSSRDTSYTTQKEHWLGWLSEYNGPGYYGRKNSCRSAEFVYNHIVCPPMVLWLLAVLPLKIFTLAHASSNVPSTVKCSSEVRPFSPACATT
jgi:hypothetical protein